MKHLMILNSQIAAESFIREMLKLKIILAFYKNGICISYIIFTNLSFTFLLVINNRSFVINIIVINC